MEEKRPLRIPWLRSMDSIKIDLKEMWWCDLNWINLAQDRDQWRILVNTATNFFNRRLGTSELGTRSLWLLKYDSSL
jgi:hypothetical protein